MSIELSIDPVVMRKIEKSAEAAGKSVKKFIADFFCGKGRPTLLSDSRFRNKANVSF